MFCNVRSVESVTMNHTKGLGLGHTVGVGRSRVQFPMVSLEFFIDIILLAAL